jgi:hypothetical protein
VSCLICAHGPETAKIVDDALGQGASPHEARVALMRAGVTMSSWAVMMHRRHREAEAVREPEPPVSPPSKRRKRGKPEPEPEAPAAGFDVVELQPVHPKGLRELVKDMATALEVAQRRQLEIVKQQQERILAGDTDANTKREIASLKVLDDLLRRLREFREAELSLPVEVRVVLPLIHSADDIADALQVITDAALSGRITHGEAKLLADILDKRREVLKLKYFEHRLRELESKVIEVRAAPALLETNADAG